jgi:glucose/arabinose dehydrogenase
VSLSFPVFAIAPADGSNRLFIVEKNGVIKILNLVTQQLLPTPFLDLTGQIATSGEQGLLGLAFHPNFSQNGFFYINVVTPAGFTEIRRYRVSSTDPNQADPSSSTLVIRIDQHLPGGFLFSNHKAGWLDFGPDGYLYIALGDGGSGGDPQNVAQNLSILLGKMLRLNVDMDDFPVDPDRNYAIPADNPFAGAIPGADEIWALGLRNPWRASFDRGTGDFYIADVGQGAREEVNASISATGGGRGANYGWKIMEGTNCFSPPCDVPGLTPPVLEYDHSGGACSITGGYVYRGNVIPALQGTYFYADYCLGFVRSFRLSGGMATERTDWPTLDPNENITSFGEDAAGELYIVTQQGGLYRIVPN